MDLTSPGSVPVYLKALKKQVTIIHYSAHEATYEGGHEAKINEI